MKPKNNPHLDSWHYLDYRDEKHDKNYIEWKYFNFTQKGLAGYIVYYILGPEEKTSMAGGRLLVRIFKDGDSFGAVKKIGMDRIECDAVSATIKMNEASISEVSSYQYDISGSIENFSWNLSYHQAVPTIDSFHKVNPGLMRWERMNWLIKMPRAQVRGELRVNGEIIPVDGLGYSDTNWGEIMPFFSRYEWGQYNGDGFSFVFGVLYGLKNIKNGYFYFVVDNKVVSLENAKWEIKHDSWITGIEGIKIPDKNSFIIKEEEYVVKFSSQLIQHDILGLKIS